MLFNNVIHNAFAKKRHFTLVRQTEVIKIREGAEVAVRLVDCVGFAVEGANGFEEDGMPRLVNTPWQAEPMPFEQAAAMGTEKVINEHSTIGVMVTTDGSALSFSLFISPNAFGYFHEKVLFVNIPFPSSFPICLGLKTNDEPKKNQGTP